MLFGRKRSHCLYLRSQPPLESAIDAAILNAEVNQSAEPVRSIIVELVKIDHKGVESGVYACKRQRLKEKDARIFGVPPVHVTDQISKLFPNQIAFECAPEGCKVTLYQALKGAGDDLIAFFLHESESRCVRRPRSQILG